MNLKKILFIFFTLLLTIDSYANNTLETLKGLPQIASFVKDVCTAPSLKGNSSSLELNARASSKTSKLIKKLIALNVDGAAKYSEKKYNTVLQKELAKVIKDSNNCRLEALRLLQYHFSDEGVTRKERVNKVPPEKKQVLKKKRKLIILVSPFENLTGIREEIITDREDPNKIKRIKYTVDRYTEAPRALLENILLRNRNVTIIERQRLDKILLETEYIRSGYVDSKYLIKIGKQLGANTIAFGTLVSINDKVSKFKGYGIETIQKIITATIRFRLIDIKSSKGIFSTIAKGQSIVNTSQYSSISSTDGRYEAIEDAINHLASDKDFRDYLTGADR